jgi:predicted ferric reductase
MRRAARIAARNALTVTAVLLYPLSSVALFFQGNWYSFFHSYSLAMFFGLVAFCYFSLALVLGARVKALDRIFGHDRILAFHGMIAVSALACALAHAALKLVYFSEPTVQSKLGFLGLVLFLAVILLTVLLMLETPLSRMRPFSAPIKALKKRVRADYTLLKLLHNLAAPAFAIIVVHVILAYSVQETGSRIAFALVTGALALAFYAYHKVARPLILLLNAHAVSGVTKLSRDIVEVKLAPRRGRPLKYKAGQFAFFRFLSGETGFGEHPFTISSSPSAEALSLTAKALGDFTAKLGALKENTRCLVDGPYGLFYPKPNGANLLFVAGGIGITPFLSILRDFAERAEKRTVTLIWSIRLREEAFALKELEAIASRVEGFAFRILVIDEPAFGKDTADKMIDADLIRETVARFGSVQRSEAYICGPAPLRRAVYGYLVKAGFKDAQILYESFSL